jgi:hypothetical protein
VAGVFCIILINPSVLWHGKKLLLSIWFFRSFILLSTISLVAPDSYRDATRGCRFHQGYETLIQKQSTIKQ